MRGEQQHAVPAGRSQPHRAQQHPAFGVQPVDRPGGVVGHCRAQITNHRNLFQFPTDVGSRSRNQGHGGAVHPAAQHLVAADDAGQGGLQLVAAQRLRDPDGFGLGQSARLAVFVEPAAVGQQRHRARSVVHFARGGSAFRVDRFGKFADAGAVENEPGAQRDSAGPGRLDHREIGRAHV